MPYMIIRSCMIPGPNQAFNQGTFLEFHVADSVYSGSELPPDGDLAALLGKPLDAKKRIDYAGFCSYHTSKPPYFVLDTLEVQGYKVVAAHTAIKDGNNILVWTLQKPM